MAGTRVIITGTNFSSTRSVAFNGTSAGGDLLDTHVTPP
jgi:hypothetical protein